MSSFEDVKSHDYNEEEDNIVDFDEDFDVDAMSEEGDESPSDSASQSITGQVHKHYSGRNKTNTTTLYSSIQQAKNIS